MFLKGSDIRPFFVIIVLMIIVVLSLLGLCLGSFVNALVWRVHQQSLPVSKRPKKTDLSIRKGRSVCTHCHHKLEAGDLIPVISWIALRGRCRYCHKPISWQYPVVELSTAVMFIVSYLFWPSDLNTFGDTVVLGFWLAIVVSLMALVVYDFRWMLLPNRIMVYTLYLAVFYIVSNVLVSSDYSLISQSILASIVGGGLFMGLFYMSNGKWIGGGDVKLGFVLGLIAGTPLFACLMLFFASLLGTFFALPTILLGSKSLKTKIPFGPFLIAGCFVAVLFGQQITDYYIELIGY